MEHFHKTMAIFNKIVSIFYANDCTRTRRIAFSQCPRRENKGACSKRPAGHLRRTVGN